jgi:hypothetical protein
MGLLALGGCATTPDDGLLSSTEVVQTLAFESAPVIEVARFSRKKVGEPLPARWRPYIILPSKPRTEYRLVDTGDGIALEGFAERAASGLYRRLRIDPHVHSHLEWRWRVPRLIPGADARVAAREDSPVRLMISFHGDAQKMDVESRAKLRLAKALSGQSLPYATLMYVWSNQLAPGTVVNNPHIDRIRMIVVESGARRLGRWVEVRRHLVEDFRKAFGEEPGDIVAVGLMTDADNTGSTARGVYGDITIRRD